MIDFTVSEDLERTQRLPTLTPHVLLDETLLRERAARIEIVELMRQNLRQAKEIEQLRSRHMRPRLPHADRLSHTIEQHVTTEQGLFEVCGALKDTLSKVLRECGTRSLALDCGNAARRALEDSCDRLEQILSAPGFLPSAANRSDSFQKAHPPAASQLTEPALRSISVVALKRLVPVDGSRSTRTPRLEILKSIGETR